MKADWNADNSETHPSVQSVSLVGSWDNFTQSYPMERDVRRDRGQWRGCYEFKNIICDGNQPAIARRNGGLKMGQPYYYYVSIGGGYLLVGLVSTGLFTDFDLSMSWTAPSRPMTHRGPLHRLAHIYLVRPSI